MAKKATKGLPKATRAKANKVAAAAIEKTFSNVSVRVNAKPRAQYERAARLAGVSLSDWIRSACDAAVLAIRETRKAARDERKGRVIPDPEEPSTVPKKVRKVRSPATTDAASEGSEAGASLL